MIRIVLVLITAICLPITLSFNVFLKKTSYEGLQLYSSKKSRSDTSQVESYLKMKTMSAMIAKKTNSTNGEDSRSPTTKLRRDYRQFIGKGSLEQRLRAVVAYKRSLVNEGQINLMQAQSMSDELGDEDEDLFEETNIAEAKDEEEAEYESLVLKIMEMNKLNAIKGLLLEDQKLATYKPNEESNTNNNTMNKNTSSLANESQKNNSLYSPAVSTWGVFERPRDISQSYGGGRVITSTEIAEMDAKYAEMKRTQESQLMKTLNQENQERKTIEKILSRSRELLNIGDNVNAVRTLEEVIPLVTYQSDFGGQVLLEYAMALETVDRLPEARQIYSKILTTSWSTIHQRHAMQLLSGLDVTRQINTLQNNSTNKNNNNKRLNSKPIFDDRTYNAIYDVLKAKNKNTNSIRESSNKYYDSDIPYTTWFNRNKNNMKNNNIFDSTTEKRLELPPVNTLQEAYSILIEQLHPLSELPTELLLRALRRVYLVSTIDKYEFLDLRYRQYLQMIQRNQLRKKQTPSYRSINNRSNNKINNNNNNKNNKLYNSESLLSDDLKLNPFETGLKSIQEMFGYTNDNHHSGNNNRVSYDTDDDNNSNHNDSSNYSDSQLKQRIREYLTIYLNGTWDLMTTIHDSPKSMQMRRYQLGDLRRIVNIDASTFEERFSTFFGLLSRTIFGNYQCLNSQPTATSSGSSTTSSSSGNWYDDSDSLEVTLDGDGLNQSFFPWQDKKKSIQNFQVVYCDDNLMVIRQSSDQLSRPDIYSLWKKVSSR